MLEDEAHNARFNRGDADPPLNGKRVHDRRSCPQDLTPSRTGSIAIDRCGNRSR